jgi:rod shape-determining protein MreD
MRKTMKANNFTVYAVILTSIVLSIILSLWPLPGTMNWLRPAWIQLVLIYWAIVLPQRIGLTWAWVIGILADSLHGCLLGIHALACLLSLYLACSLRRQFMLAPLWMQMVVIMLLIWVYQLVIFLVQGFTGQVISGWRYWLPSFSSALAWPLVYFLLHTISKRYRLH